MSSRYKQSSSFSGVTRFTKTPMVDVEFSSMVSDPSRYLSFNAGDIVPVECFEVLPHSTYSIDLEYVCRQLSASIRPTMGTLQYDIFAFFVPNRVVNDSWKNVQGENTSGFWIAPEVSLCPLTDRVDGSVQIPVGSIADYYGLPTQSPIPNAVLSQMNDLCYCGYVDIYNNYFRDQNYQPPVPISKLNVHKGFLRSAGTNINLVPSGGVPAGTSSDGGYENGGAVVKALFGEGSQNLLYNTGIAVMTTFSILDKPFKANKLHDPFTSVLPTPQKGPDVYFGIGSEAPVVFDTVDGYGSFSSGIPLQFSIDDSELESGSNYELRLGAVDSNAASLQVDISSGTVGSGGINVTGTNLTAIADLTEATGVTVNDLRIAVATQHVYELLARGGSRYWSFLKSFFGVETVNPFPDIPTQIGHIRREMDLYQVAQTSPSQEGGSPQGSLTAFGYTAKGGSLFTKTFLEHGYVHILAVVRHRQIYSTFVSPDKFRRNTLDFYLPQFANISEQPIRLATLNPFRSDSLDRAIGYNEAFWEYRYSPNTCAGYLRTGIDGSLDVWHYGDYYDSEFTHVNGEWLISDTQEVLDRTLAVTSELAPQFIAQFDFRIKKQLPMPVYSVPGLDTI